MTNLVTFARLKQVLDYDPETGVFTWLISPSGRVPAGSKAGNVDSHGYLRVQIDGRRYKAHRLAWLFMTGQWPTLNIDHRDRDRLNNRWGNIREATYAENRANTPVSARSLSGLKGVKYKKRDRVWHATICVGQKKMHLGTFRDPLDAHKAYAAAAVRFHGEFARA